MQDQVGAKRRKEVQQEDCQEMLRRIAGLNVNQLRVLHLEEHHSGSNSGIWKMGTFGHPIWWLATLRTRSPMQIINRVPSVPPVLGQVL